MREYTYVSTDSHLEQPPEMWRPYVDEEFQQWVPKTVTLPNGGQGLFFPSQSADSDAPIRGAASVVPLGLQYVSTVAKDRVVEGRWRTAAPTGNRYVLANGETMLGCGDGHQRLREMDQDGVDADVLFPAVFGGRALKDLPREAHAAVCRGYNDWLSQEYTAADPDRLWGLALVPPYVEDAIEEMRRVAGLPGIYAVAGWPAVDKDDDRFWEAALELHMPLTTHGAGAPPAGVAWPPPEKLEAVPGGAVRGMVGMQFILSGVLDRLPDLHFFFAETGIGWLPYTYEILDELYERHNLWTDYEFSKPPSEYFKKHFHWSFMVDRHGIEQRHDIGLSQIMWSTDFPHMNTDWPESRKIIEEEFDGVPDDDVRMITRDNALDYFRVREAVAA
jgi:predicted TIM-barrel fold metal-dependent hydrolase